MAIKPCDDEKIDNFTDYILNNYIEDKLISQPPCIVSWVTIIG